MEAGTPNLSVLKAAVHWKGLLEWAGIQDGFQGASPLVINCDSQPLVNHFSLGNWVLFGMLGIFFCTVTVCHFGVTLALDITL